MTTQQTHVNQDVPQQLQCVICGDKIPIVFGWAGGHNAAPVHPGRCCGDCNASVVIPTRLATWFGPRAAPTDDVS